MGTRRSTFPYVLLAPEIAPCKPAEGPPVGALAPEIAPYKPPEGPPVGALALKSLARGPPVGALALKSLRANPPRGLPSAPYACSWLPKPLSRRLGAPRVAWEVALFADLKCMFMGKYLAFACAKVI